MRAIQLKEYLECYIHKYISSHQITVKSVEVQFYLSYELVIVIDVIGYDDPADMMPMLKKMFDDPHIKKYVAHDFDKISFKKYKNGTIQFIILDYVYEHQLTSI